MGTPIGAKWIAGFDGEMGHEGSVGGCVFLDLWEAA